MLTRIICAAVLIFATPLSAQEICATTPDGLVAAQRAIAEVQSFARPVIPAQGLWPLDEKLKELNESFPPTPRLTPWGSDATPYMYGQMFQAQPQEKETRFSWWGYGHDELHAKDLTDPESYSVIDELESKFGKGNCCSGIHSGECRITKFEEDRDPTSTRAKQRVIVDGEACDVSSTTKFTSLSSFKRPGYIVVCAAKTYRSSSAAKGTATCSTYCIGTAGGF